MGKKSRLKKEKRENPPFCITVGAAMADGATDNNIAAQVDHHSRLIKAALLYADKVSLCGPVVNMVLSISRMNRFSDNQKIELLRLVAPTLSNGSNLPDGLEKILQFSKALEILNSPIPHSRSVRANLSESQKAEIAEISSGLSVLRTGLDEAFAEISSNAVSLAQELGIDELKKLIDKGHVNVVKLGPSLSDAEIIAGSIQSSAHLKQRLETGRVFGSPLKLNEDGYKESVFSDLLDSLNSLINSRTEYPLFDNFTSNLIYLGIKGGRFEVSDIQKERAKHIGLSASLLERLPLFDEATVEEIIDIKNDLEKPLINFRQAMMKYSKDMALGAWDPEFQIEAESIFRMEIEPTVLALEDELRSNKYLLEVARRLPEKPFAISGTSALGVALANAQFLGETWLSVASFGASMTVLAADAWKEYIAGKKANERNQLFFYVKAKQKIRHGN